MHDLVEHLTRVAELARDFASKFGAGELGYWAGVWHDLGKFHPDFQAYLQNPTPAKGPDHKGAGSVIAAKVCEPLAFLVAGHHGGLYAGARLKSWLKEKAKAPQVEEALRLAQKQLLKIEPIQPVTPPTYVRTELDAEFFVRMVFSALTDADFLDTERHFDTKKSKRREFSRTVADLWELFEVNQQGLTGKRQDRVNIIRDEVPRGAIYYHSSRRRREVEFPEALRAEVEAATKEIRKMLSEKRLPPPVNDKRCRHCSLQESCMPGAVGDRGRAAELLRTLFEAS